MVWRGKSRVIRCHNGFTYISTTLLNWASARAIHVEQIQPGRPQQNTCVERFNRTVRSEWQSQYHWPSRHEVWEFATQWMRRYNHECPNFALSDITPIQWLALTAQPYFSER